MNRSHMRSFVIAGFLAALAVTAYAGGWAVVTVQNLPDYFVAGKPETLVFTIRQHGRTLADDLDATLSASDSNGLSAKAAVSPTGKPGEYRAVFTVPQAGDWTIRIGGGGFGDSSLLPIKAFRAGSPAPPPLKAEARGERLFVAKGCITCHVNREVAAKNLLSAGPDLTGRKYPADFLSSFLADPQKMVKKNSSATWDMPNLNLSKEEIHAIGAFMNRDRS